MEFHAFLVKGTAIFFAILSGMFGGISVPPATDAFTQATTTKATTTLAVLPTQGTGFFTPTWPNLSPISSSSGNFFSFTPPKPVVVTPPPSYSVVPPSVTAPTPVPEVQPEPEKEESVASETEFVENAIVHILCTSKKTGLRSISGSGSIIDSRGIILTAAHVGQYLLIEKASGGVDMTCSIRIGDPARAAYKAVPLYISQSWVTENTDAITQSMATGNGKNDFGLLAITGTANGGSLPSSFPYIPLSSSLPKKGDSIVIGTYGAEFLTSEQIRSSLSPTIVETSIQKIYSLRVTDADLMSLGASAAAQSGSSGGVVVHNGKAIGVVTTSSLGADRSTRDLRAITLNHIRKGYETETNGSSLDLDLQGNISSLIQRFAGTQQALAEALMDAIEQ